jgi:hypothetical protein
MIPGIVAALPLVRQQTRLCGKTVPKTECPKQRRHQAAIAGVAEDAGVALRWRLLR